MLRCVLSALLAIALVGCDDDPAVPGTDAGSDAETDGGASACLPACDGAACMVCDTSGATATCRSTCGSDLMCEDGVCLPPDAITCDPGCGDCQYCDTSGETPTCTDVCADGLTCEAGVCEAPPPPACDPACGECEVCDTSGEAPVCVGTCGSGEMCSAGACVRLTAHSFYEALQGPFATGPEVTATCITCHEDEATDLMGSSHWTWGAPVPGDVVGAVGGDVGKGALINNFCIATASNERRCAQCHSGYGMGKDPAFSFAEMERIDCLVCHADPRSGYSKAPKEGGEPAATVDLVLAAQSVGPTTRQNCGSCHFFAGGGDNVKIGDMGSVMANPPREVDVHMGMGFTCSTCHVSESHDSFPGRSLHSPGANDRVTCADCHEGAVHDDAILDNHALDIACQTCHVPAFSRTQLTKTFWDWSTAGNRTRGTEGIERAMVGTFDSVVYNFMKGDFIWEYEVRPSYAWYDGGVNRLTTGSSYASGMGTAANPVDIASPTAIITDGNALIYPFKVMTGRQAAHLADRYLIVPHLFGPGGFWPLIPTADTYTEEAVLDLWTTTLTDGARAAGQIGGTDTITRAEWDWVSTQMHLRINHEVAPATQALGAGGACTDCHGNPDFDFIALGYSCDPVGDPTGCGSRH